MTQALVPAAELRADLRADLRTDLLGAARLGTEAVVGMASVVEAVHARIAGPLRLPVLGPGARQEGRAGGVSGLVYQAVRGITRVAGAGAESLLSGLAPVWPAPELRQAPRPVREAVLAALNGAFGDHLAASDNPLAIPMRLRSAGRPLRLQRPALRADLPGATPRVLVLLHGLCMNDLQWRRAGQDHGHGQALARDLGYTPVYLHYNSGLPVSANGRGLADLLARLCAAWPVPVERLVLLGHSMGGLVARSALHHAALARRGGRRRPVQVDDLVCLGTPHHGAPLEQAGHGLDLLLGAAPCAAPLARLGKRRSAGINDLRQGNILGAAPGNGQAHAVCHVALPDGTRCHAVAACLGPSRESLKTRLLGDGLVPMASALGQHPDPERCLAFAEDRQAVVTATGHLELLASAQVYGHLRRWLA